MTDTYVDYIDSSLFVLSIGDGATPETFTAYATINKNRSFDRTAQVSAQVVPNLDPTRPGKVVRKAQATDWSLAGDGTLHALDAPLFETWYASGAARNVQVNAGSELGDLTYSGPAILGSYVLTGAGIGEHVQAALKLSAADTIDQLTTVLRSPVSGQPMLSPVTGGFMTSPA